MYKLLFYSIGLFGFITLFSCKMGVEQFDSLSIDNNFVKEVLDDQFSNSVPNTSKDFDYLPTSTTHQLVKHSYYTFSYNEKAEQPEWVAYELKKKFIKNNDFKRPYFIQDPLVKTGSADWRNYKNSGYDKGHLCPAADMEFDLDAYNETFFTSNVSPQLHDFNAGIWNRLEQKVRYWAARYDGIYVVTGGVLLNTRNTIGNEKVVVPDYFYKIILDDNKGTYKIIAFLIPNKKSSKPLYSYVVSVDSLEKMTGIDFFPQLNDKIENNLERNTDCSSWFKK